MTRPSLEAGKFSLFSDDIAARRLFADCFDRKPFLFKHQLHSHELLTISALKKLALKMGEGKKPRGYFWLAEQPKGLEWGSREFRTGLDDAFDRIESSGMRLKLSSVHHEPEYGELLAACTRELSELAAVDLERDYRDALATVFITSPGEVTPYHVDSEINFLIQLRGTKAVYIFDGNDRDVVSWSDLEEYFHGSRHIRLRDEFRSRGVPFDLQPGVAVHNPPYFPHWVQNGPLPSISLAVSYSRIKNDPHDILHINRYLRKLGIEPIPPGRYATIDGAKRAVLRATRSIKSVLHHR